MSVLCKMWSQSFKICRLNEIGYKRDRHYFNDFVSLFDWLGIIARALCLGQCDFDCTGCDAIIEQRYLFIITSDLVCHFVWWFKFTLKRPCLVEDVSCVYECGCWHYFRNNIDQTAVY